MDEPAALGGAAIEWGRPWFAPWRGAGEAVLAQVAAGQSLPAALNAAGGAALRFAPASTLPVGQPYERHIFERGECPTRDNLHDFFNGLCWLVMPQSKRRLNELQAAEIASAGIGAARGRVRDAITIFDENGAVLQAPPALWQALRERQWRHLFVELRPLWPQAHLLVFGHALLEQLAQPRKDLTAHVWATPAPAGSPEAIDAWLASQFTPGQLATKPFTPLPVLGVPGWWPQNENFSFYDDSLVFRAARAQELKTTLRAAAPRP